jgi:hypothetical protein
MANLTVNFSEKINVSLQPGDTVYFLKSGELTTLGNCISVASDRLSLVVDVPSTASRPAIGDYFMFAKNNVINSSGLIGYQATIKMQNTSTDFCELYAVNSEIMISSK